MQKKNKNKSWIEIFEECKHVEHVALDYCEALRAFDKYFDTPNFITSVFRTPLQGKDPIENEHHWYKFGYYQKEHMVINAMNQALDCWYDFENYALALQDCWQHFNLPVKIAIQNLERVWINNHSQEIKRSVAREYLKMVDVWMNSTKVLEDEQRRIDRKSEYLKAYFTALQEICEYYKSTKEEKHFQLMLAGIKDRDCWILSNDKDQISKELHPKVITLEEVKNRFILRDERKPLIIDPVIWCELLKKLA